MNAQQLKNSILQEAIEGRLVPQDPNDEPASVLLDKIRKEKARLVKEGILKKSELKDREFLSDEVPFSIPKGWEWTKVDNIAFVTKLAGFEYTKYIASNLVSKESGIPLFKGKNVQNGTIVYEFESYIPLSLSNDLKRSQINKKCLLTPYVGTIGNIGIHNREGVFHLGSNVGKIEFYNNPTTNILEEYAKYYLMSRSGYQELTKYKKATAQESISIEAIRDVFIPIPPVEEQKRIVDKISSIFAMVEEYGKAQEALDKLNKELPERLKKSILQEAIEGRLVPQDPNDEPASVLLDKIRAEKKRLVKEGKLKKKDLEEIPINEDETPFKIPEGWVWVKLQNIGYFMSGQTPKSSDLKDTEGGVPYFKVSDMNVKGNEHCMNYAALYLKANTKYKLIPKNSIIYPKNGGALLTNKKRILVTDSLVDLNTGAFVPSNELDFEYIFHLFSTIDFRKHYKGTALPTVNMESIHRLLFPLPPLSEQHRIVAKIEQLMKEIDKLKV